jgi:hypothetical protein
MKTMIIAAAAVLALSVGSAYAAGDGESGDQFQPYFVPSQSAQPQARQHAWNQPQNAPHAAQQQGTGGYDQTQSWGNG